MQKLVLATVTTVLSMCLLELGARTYLAATGRGFSDNADTFRSPFITMLWEPDPLVRGVRLKFKDTWISRHKPAGETRILFLGGSTTENARAGVRFTDLLESRLQADLAPRALKCLNAGTSGYSTAHSIVNFSLRAIEADPDLVVVMHNLNDLSVADFEGAVEPDFGNKYKQNFYLGYRHRTGLVDEVLKVSRLARWVAYRFNAIQYPATAVQTANRDRWMEALRLFDRNLRTLAGIAKSHGIRMVLMTEPARSDLRNNSAFAAFNERVRVLGAELSVPVIDLAGAVTVDGDFVDAIHFNRKGTLAAVEVLAPRIRALIADAATMDSVGHTASGP